MHRRAGLYLRISQDRTGEGLAVERQREDGRKLIAQRGWTLAQEYVDNDVSAAGRKPRPGFDALLHAVEDKQITVIVAWSLDRLTRNRRDQLRLIETCQHHSTLVALVRGSDMDMSSAVGRAMADMMAVWARMEIEQKSERQIRAIQQAAEAGRMVGGRRAFGYSADGMELDPVEAPIVKLMYDKFLAGATLSDLAQWLNDQGIRTTRGLRWALPSVRVILANPRNAGQRGIRRVVDPKTGLRDVWHELIGKAVWPPIVPVTTWEAAVAILKDPTRPGRRNNPRSGNQPKYLLTNIARCGTCGAGMVASYNERFRLLRCRFGHHSRRADYIEAYVVEVLLSRLSEPDAADLLRVVDTDFDAEAARAEAAGLRAKLAGLAADYADGVLDREQMRIVSNRHRARLTELAAALADVGQVDPVAGLVHADDPSKTWDSYPLAAQRAVLDELMEIRVLKGRAGSPSGARFHPDTVQITWRPTRPR